MEKCYFYTKSNTPSWVFFTIFKLYKSCRKSHMSRYLIIKVSCYHVIALCTYFFFYRSLYLFLLVLVFILKEKHVVWLIIKIWVFFIRFRIIQSSRFHSLHGDKFYKWYQLAQSITRDTFCRSRMTYSLSYENSQQANFETLEVSICCAQILSL